MNNKLVPVLIAALFAGAYFIGQWLQSRAVMENNLPSHPMRHEPCNPVVDNCIAFIGEHKFVLKFMQPPSALKPFTVRVLSENVAVDGMELEFTMQDMDMGVNRFRLHPATPQEWSAEVILPVCSLGRNDWTSRLRVMYQGELWIADFGFKQRAD